MEKTVAFLYSKMYQKNKNVTFLEKLYLSITTISILLLVAFFCFFATIYG